MLLSEASHLFTPRTDPLLRLLPTASVSRSCKDIGEAWMQCVKDTNCYKSGKSIRICIRQDPEACNVSIPTSRIPDFQGRCVQWRVEGGPRSARRSVIRHTSLAGSPLRFSCFPFHLYRRVGRHFRDSWVSSHTARLVRLPCMALRSQPVPAHRTLPAASRVVSLSITCAVTVPAFLLTRLAVASRDPSLVQSTPSTCVAAFHHLTISFTLHITAALILIYHAVPSYSPHTHLYQHIFLASTVVSSTTEIPQGIHIVPARSAEHAYEVTRAEAVRAAFLAAVSFFHSRVVSQHPL